MGATQFFFLSIFVSTAFFQLHFWLCICKCQVSNIIVFIMSTDIGKNKRNIHSMEKNWHIHVLKVARRVNIFAFFRRNSNIPLSKIEYIFTWHPFDACFDGVAVCVTMELNHNKRCLLLAFWCRLFEFQKIHESKWTHVQRTAKFKPPSIPCIWVYIFSYG